MQSKLNPYINFNGEARAAAEFYHGVFGGKLTMSTFKEAGVPHDASEGDHIMHSMLVADNGITLMISDTPKGMGRATAGNNISVSVSGDDEAELKGYWEKLSEGAKITMPLGKAPWGDVFGMLTDKFGISWLVNIAGKK